jgi:hypothetical protein
VTDGSANVWLATMAVALVVMALVQVGVIIVLARVGLQAARTVKELRRDIKPLIEKANRVADDAARASALAVVQMERVDRLIESTVERVDETLGVVQDAVLGPLRTGSALLAALRAGFAMFRGWQGRTRPTRDDEDALFVG